MAASLNDAVRKLLDEPNPAVLGTVNPDGSPQTSVVWVGRDDNDLLISTAAGRRKERNIRRDPRVSLSVYDQADPRAVRRGPRRGRGDRRHRAQAGR